MNIKEIQDLILTINKTSIENVDIEKSGFKISISKDKKILSSPREVGKEDIIEVEKSLPKNQVISTNEIEEDSVEDLEPCNDMFVVKSPIVGTYYDAPSPDSDAYVEIGDKVKIGQTLCIIEAMKIMNEIENEIDGEIYEILVKNEDVVEYDQPLMIIRR